MKGEWERSIKPQFTPENKKKEYIVAVPAEAFGGKGLDDATKDPPIKKGRIHFKGFVSLLWVPFTSGVVPI